MILIHYPGGEFTPCGVRFLMPAPNTLHTDDCLAGREMCIGIHVTAVHSSNSPRIVNCPQCIVKIMEDMSETKPSSTPMCYRSRYRRGICNQEEPMTDDQVKDEYGIEVTRDGRWWMINIPAVGGLTQARRLSEVEYMARDYLALVTHTPIDDIAVHVVTTREEKK